MTVCVPYFELLSLGIRSQLTLIIRFEPAMPDSFFTSSKPRKRKRTASFTQALGKSKKFARNSVASQESKKSGLTKANGAHKRKSRADEELSDQTDEEDGGVDDMDLGLI